MLHRVYITGALMASDHEVYTSDHHCLITLVFFQRDKSVFDIAARFPAF